MNGLRTVFGGHSFSLFALGRCSTAFSLTLPRSTLCALTRSPRLDNQPSAYITGNVFPTRYREWQASATVAKAGTSSERVGFGRRKLEDPGLGRRKAQGAISTHSKPYASRRTYHLGDCRLSKHCTVIQPSSARHVPEAEPTRSLALGASGGGNRGALHSDCRRQLFRCRRIQVLTMKDRIAVHAVMSVGDEHLKRRFIRTTSASIKWRGMHDLKAYIERDLREHPEATRFCYKFGISKFYESVSQ